MKEENKTIYYIKGLAILSVICAHCNAVFDEKNRIANAGSLLLQNIGSIGVVCFFVISGILFHYKRGQLVSFFKKRIYSICIPWIISATCVYLYVHLRKPPLSLSGWINFVIGNGSYCYYLTILMLFYLIFILLPFMRTNIAFIICEILTVFSTIWFWSIGQLSPYLNILNWIGYFALGMQLAFYPEITNRIIKYLYQLRWGIIVIYTIFLGMQIYFRNGGGYWNSTNVIVCWFGALTLILIVKMIELKENCWLFNIAYWSGKESFFIYLWHMPIAGIVAKAMNSTYLMNFVLLRPIIVLTIMIIIYFILKWLLKKFCLDQYVFLFGIGH